MKDFQYFTPTLVRFGRDAHLEAGTLVRELGSKRVLVVSGCGSAKRSGVLDSVLSSLKREGAVTIGLDGIVPNPRLEKVREGIQLGREERVELLLAIGGGSVMDTAKAIGFGLADSDPDGDVWDFFSFRRSPKASLPLVVVPTVAGSGSEMSDCAVITREEGSLKWFCDSDIGRPRFALMNPALSFSVPAFQTACGCTDILMHTMERFFSTDSMALTDSMSLALLRTVMAHARTAVAEPEDYEARAGILWAASLSQNGLTACGTTRGDWATHALANEISGLFDVPHGAGLAAIWGSWARYVLGSSPERFAHFATEAMGTADAGHSESTAMKGIEAFEDFLRSIGMPTSLVELGIDVSEGHAMEYALRCSRDGTVRPGSLRSLGLDDLIRIYRTAGEPS